MKPLVHALIFLVATACGCLGSNWGHTQIRRQDRLRSSLPAGPMLIGVKRHAVIGQINISAVEPQGETAWLNFAPFRNLPPESCVPKIPHLDESHQVIKRFFADVPAVVLGQLG